MLEVRRMEADAWNLPEFDIWADRAMRRGKWTNDPRIILGHRPDQGGRVVGYRLISHRQEDFL